MKKEIIVYCSFDDFDSRDFRFINEAAKLGGLHVLLYSDAQIKTLTGKNPKYPAAERRYAVESLRNVLSVSVAPDNARLDELPGRSADVRVDFKQEINNDRKKFCKKNKIKYRVFSDSELKGFPLSKPEIDLGSQKKRVIVTGCYDWVHTGHIRFLEEASGYGDLYVVVGSDKNLRLLKGDGHPMFPENERLYMLQSIRFVRSAMLSTGSGWMDAEPEVQKIKPDIYIINEDSSGQDEKRAFCEKYNIKLVILKRVPKEGLPSRTSTDLRGF